MSSSRELDQFYTSPVAAALCWDALCRGVRFGPDALFLEPAAGTGAFFSLLPADRRLGLDLDPKCDGVAKADFLEFELDPSLGKPIVTVGNPPFGRNANLAVRFFNHAARFSQVIAFVVPRTFEKASIQRRLDAHFHLLPDSFDLPKNSFEFQGKVRDLPCCFQVWERRSIPREATDEPLTHPDFSFVKREHAHFAVRRVGRLAGTVLLDFDGYANTSHYFLRAAPGRVPQAIAQTLRGIDWSDIKAHNAGVPCIGKRELVREYDRALRSSSPA